MRFSLTSYGLAASLVVSLPLACGGDDASSSDEGAAQSAGSAGASAGSAGKAGSPGAGAGGSSAGTGGSAAGAAGAVAGKAGAAGSSAGAAGSAGASAGAGGAVAGAAGASAGAGGASAGKGGAAGGAGTSGAAGKAGGSAGSAGAASDAKCTPSMPCQSPDEFCNYSDNLCGATMYVGHCKARPSGCSGLFSPVCGCDGKVYSNSCSANAAGFDLANEGTCTPPDSKLFACGPYFCDKATEYCEKIRDLPSIADSYECKSLPPICAGVASCDCLDKTICGAFECVDTTDGGHRTVCPGP